MKLAPWVALAAIALLMAGGLASRGTPPSDKYQTVDFTGIDTLVLKLPESLVEVTMGGSRGRLASKFPSDEAVHVTRQANVLTIESEDPWVELEAPATLRRIVGGANFKVVEGASVADLLLEGGESLTWSGDAKRLRVIHSTEPARDTCRCPHEHEHKRTVGEVDIKDGKIGTLWVSSERGRVRLGNVEDIGQATLELGEQAEYELGGMHGKPPEVTLLALPAAKPSAPDNVAKPAPSEPAAEPPRQP